MKKALPVFLALALLPIILSGCSKSIDELITEGRLHQAAHRYEEAVEVFNTILEREPESLEAYRGLANAHGARDEMTQQEEHLRKGLATIQSLDQENPETRARRDRDRKWFTDQLEELYVRQARAATPAKPEEYEGFLLQVLEINPESSRANLALAQFYGQQATTLRQEDDLRGAAEQYRKITRLSVNRDTRLEADFRADQILSRFFREQFQKDVREKYRAELVRRRIYNPRTSTFTTTGEYQVPADKDQDAADFSANVRYKAAMAAFTSLLTELAEIMEISMPEELPRQLQEFNPASWEESSSSWVRRGQRYRVVANMGFDDTSDAMYLLIKAIEQEENQ